MICPTCGSEYVDGIVECFDCGVALVEAPQPMKPDRTLPKTPEWSMPKTPGWSLPETAEPVVVLTSGRAEIIAIAKSILLSSGIEYAVYGEWVQDLFGYGRFPAGSNVFMGPVEIVVSARDAPDARVLLEELTSSAPVPDAVELESDAAGAFENLSMWRTARTWAGAIAAVMVGAMILSFLWEIVSG